MATTQLLIRLTHTGLLSNGRVNTNPVLVNDLETGHDFQLRKVAVYVPVGGSITIPLSGNGLLSLANGVIDKFVNAGVLTAHLFLQPESFSDITRPLALGAVITGQA